MTRGRISKYLKMTSFMVDPEIYEQFLETIPRSKSVGETLREYMESVVEEHKKEKNLNAPDYSAIKQLGSNNSNESCIYIHDRQLTLDIFQSKRDINMQLNNIKELQDMRTARDRGKMIYAIMDTRIRRLVLTKSG